MIITPPSLTILPLYVSGDERISEKGIFSYGAGLLAFFPVVAQPEKASTRQRETNPTANRRCESVFQKRDVFFFIAAYLCLFNSKRQFSSVIFSIEATKPCVNFSSFQFTFVYSGGTSIPISIPTLRTFLAKYPSIDSVLPRK